MNAEQTVKELLSQADIHVDGQRPWDIKVHNPKFYSRVLAQGPLGLGESYMDCWWDCDRIDEMIFRMRVAELDRRVPRSLLVLLPFIQARLTNMQSKSRAFEVGEKHYDIGNDLYRAMLDKRMTYTCGYWKSTKTLDKAQEAKLDLACKKLKLKPGMTVLDIGCGWGSFAKYAASKYKVNVVGITVSKEQAALAREICNGLPVEILLQDYRDVQGTFDRIVSLGMFEHVGQKNYRTYMTVAHQCLKDDGLFLLHTIGSDASSVGTDVWVSKYIFPNGVIPCARSITAAAEDLFIMEDWHNFGPYYDLTLMAWHKNFEASWGTLKNTYNERFHRMWRYYLLIFAGSFRARKLQLWQIVFSKGGIKSYESVR